MAEANNTRFGLSASLISGSPDLYDRFWGNVRAGVVNWNRPTNGALQRAVRRRRPVGQSPPERLLDAADYCAYPVTSVEADQPRAGVIAVGLQEG